MAAIITSYFRLTNAKTIVDNVADFATPSTPRYYIGLGKSDPWSAGVTETVPAPNTAQSVLDNAKKNLVAICLITSASLVVPRINWRGTTTPQIFKTYNRWDASSMYTTTSGGTTYNAGFAYYDGAVYICTKAGAGYSTVAPSNTATVIGTIGSIEADGYQWVKICTVDTLSVLFQRDFIPVVSTTGSATASAGAVYGYTGTPTGSGAQTILGDGTGATATVTTGVLDITATGSNYINANINAQPTVTLLVAPVAGFGATPSEDLPAWYVSTAADFEGSADGLIPTTNDYRQITLIQDAVLDTPATLLEPIVPALKSINIGVGTPAAGLIADAIITDSAGAKAFVSHTSLNLSAETIVYYIQNDSSSVNCKPFVTGSVSWSGGSGTIASVDEPNYNPGTGRVLFLENRSPITRSETQVEQVRVVLQF